MNDVNSNRRPIRARSSAWAKKLASFSIKNRISPNQISVASVFFAAFGVMLLMAYPIPAGLIGCAVAIQGRLLCNLLDGMVAIEGGRQSVLGPLFNEFPDRIADSMLIVALGYASNLPALGWLGALAAVLTAYVRAFGGSLGLPQDFRGPMAKPQRMATMTVGCLLGALELALAGTVYTLGVACAVIAAGSLATCATRSWAIARRLQGKGA